ncbi:MAG: chromate efflux transporter [Verrucomicrobiota bacterium]
MADMQSHRTTALLELAGVFSKLGLTAFGGPAAHVAMMEQEFVRQRAWLSHEEFLDLLGATNLIPGPNSTEMAIYVGRRRAGWAGLVVAGVCFILPAALLVGLIAWAYVRLGKLPQAEGLLYGIKPVIMAVILQALWGLGRVAVKSRFLAVIGLAAVVLNCLGVNELVVLFGTGFLVAAGRAGPHGQRGIVSGLFPLLGFATGAPLVSAVGISGAAVAVPFSVGALFLFFVKVGSVLFGSGYVLLAFLRADLVERWHWLSESQLLDAIAVGQVTPGPLFTTATFIGYLLGGPVAAVVATVGIFLPAFFFVAISGPLVPRLRASPVAGAFLDGVNVASLALMGVVTWQLGAAALVDWLTLLLAVAAAILLLRYRLNSAWLVLGGAAAGLLAAAFRG